MSRSCVCNNKENISLNITFKIAFEKWGRDTELLHILAKIKPHGDSLRWRNWKQNLMVIRVNYKGE